MKVEIIKENMRAGLLVAEKVVGKNTSLPILDNVMIEAQENYLLFISTDLEAAIKIWILTKIIKKGSIVVPARFLSGFVASLPNEKITLEASVKNLRIECQGVKTQVNGFEVEDFPIIPAVENKEFLEIDNKKLCDALAQLVDIPQNSQSRPEISGVYVVFQKNSIKMAATDSFRLGEKNITLPQSLKKDYSFILPQKTVREIVGILGEKDGVVRIYVANNQVLFELPFKEVDHPHIQITSRLIEGEYPNYQEIIPTSFKTTTTIKRDALLNQIKTASLFSGKVNEVKLSVSGEKQLVNIFSQNPTIGEHSGDVLAKVEGQDMAVSFNYKYLVDGLQNIKSSEVVFQISKEEGPCILRPLGDDSYIYVVMPIKSL